MTRIFREMLGYGAASAVALAVDVSLLTVLVRYCGMWYVAAATASFCAGLVVAYLMSVTFVFHERKVEDRRLEFLAFAALGALGLIVNTAVIYAAVHYLHLDYLPAKLVAAGFTITCNFISRRQMLFVRSNPEKATTQYEFNG